MLKKQEQRLQRKVFCVLATRNLILQIRFLPFQSADIKQHYFHNVFLAFQSSNNLILYRFYMFFMLSEVLAAEPQGRLPGRRVVVQTLQKAENTGDAFTK